MACQCDINNCNCSSVTLPNQITGVDINSSNQVVITISNGDTFISTNALTITGNNSYNLLHNNVTAAAITTGASYITVMNYTVPLNSLITNGDFIKITTVLDTIDTVSEFFQQIQIHINGSFPTNEISFFPIGKNIETVKLEMILSRTSATNLQVFGKSEAYGAGLKLFSLGQGFITESHAVADLISNTFAVEVKLQNDGGSQGGLVMCRRLTVELFKF